VVIYVSSLPWHLVVTSLYEISPSVPIVAGTQLWPSLYELPARNYGPWLRARWGAGTLGEISYKLERGTTARECYFGYMPLLGPRFMQPKFVTFSLRHREPPSLWPRVSDGASAFKNHHCFQKKSMYPTLLFGASVLKKNSLFSTCPSHLRRRAPLIPKMYPFVNRPRWIEWRYRVTSLLREHLPPFDHHTALGIAIQ